MSFVGAIESGFKNYFNFQSRASRAEYWWWTLFCLLGGFVTGFIDGMMGTYDYEAGMGTITAVFQLAVFIPGIALLVRRFHDIDRSAWWWWIVLTGIGIFVVLYWFVQPGTSGENKYGKDPYGLDA